MEKEKLNEKVGNWPHSGITDGSRGRERCTCAAAAKAEAAAAAEAGSELSERALCMHESGR